VTKKEHKFLQKQQKLNINQNDRLMYNIPENSGEQCSICYASLFTTLLL